MHTNACLVTQDGILEYILDYVSKMETTFNMYSESVKKRNYFTATNPSDKESILINPIILETN
jgi:hypothetical protein